MKLLKALSFLVEKESGVPEYLVNPTFEDAKEISDDGLLRGLVVGSNVYVWHPYSMLHSGMKSELKVSDAINLTINLHSSKIYATHPSLKKDNKTEFFNKINKSKIKKMLRSFKLVLTNDKDFVETKMVSSSHKERPEDYHIFNYKWMGGRLNVAGDVAFLTGLDLRELPFPFGIVEGHFDCSLNSLESLKNAPLEVEGHFDCSSNNLKSLVGGPKNVGGNYDCSHNNLTSLEGAPKFVNSFNCADNRLTSLEFAPDVELSFDCSNNLLVNLEGAPAIVSDFECDDNQLTSLEGAPRDVLGTLSCENNNLVSLKGLSPAVNDINLGNVNNKMELIKSLFVNGELPREYHYLAYKIDPLWPELMSLTLDDEDNDLLEALEKVSKASTEEQFYGPVPEVKYLNPFDLEPLSSLERKGAKSTYYLSDQFDPVEWAKTVTLDEPIKVSFFKDGSLMISDGHHRHLASQILRRPVEVELKAINAYKSKIGELIRNQPKPGQAIESPKHKELLDDLRRAKQRVLKESSEVTSSKLQLKAINWAYPTDKELEDEFREEDVYGIFFPGYPTKAEEQEAFKYFKNNLEEREISPEKLAKDNAWRFDFADYKSLKTQVKKYGSPKDPDSMLRKIQSGGELPMPVAVVKRGKLLLAGGATRVAIAKLAGQNIKLLVFDPTEWKTRKDQEMEDLLRSMLEGYNENS